MLEFLLGVWIPAVCWDSCWILGFRSHSSLQVRISYFREAGGVPMGRALLYLTCVGKGGMAPVPILEPHSLDFPFSHLIPVPQKCRWTLMSTAVGP